MERNMLKIALAIFVGGILGSLIATEIKPTFWWLGVIAGGSIAYICYDIKAIITAVPKAWKKATSWEIDPVYKSKDFFRRICMLGIVIINVIYGVLAFDHVEPYLKQIGENLIFGMVETAIFLSTIICVLVSFIAPFDGFFSKNEIIDSMNDERERRVFKFSLLLLVPLLLPFCFICTVTFFLGKFVYEISKFIYQNAPIIKRGAVKAFFAIGRFFKYLFLLTYADERLLCFVFAGIVAIVSYMQHLHIVGIVAGTVIGALLGVLNYRIVSVKILKLKPKAS